MIQAEPDPQKRDEYLQRLMELPNQVYFDLEFACPTLSLVRPHTHTYTQTICTRCLPSLWLKLLHAFSFDAEMG